ncbi:MAG: arylesterase [Sphingobacteriaceae bacterium]
MKFRRYAFLFVTILLSACSPSQKQTDDKKADPGKATENTAVKQNILFFGNSLTAGYGLDDPSEAFPGLIQHKIDSLHLPYKTINAGLSGETSAGGNGRIEWLLKQPIAVFVLELGANDGLRGISTTETLTNLQAIITKVKTKYPDCKLVLTGMMVPPNMGDAYANKFKGIFPHLAKINRMTFLPFLLDKVAGIPDLNQKDGIHPTPAGHRLVAENVWSVLQPIL